MSPLGALLGISLLFGATVAACGGGDSSGSGFGGTDDASAGDASTPDDAGNADATVNGDAGGNDGAILMGGDAGNCGGFSVTPATVAPITVTIGQMSPTVTFTATLNCKSVNAAWGVDKGNVGTISPTPASSTVFTPTGTTGGLVTVTANVNGQTVTRQVMVKLTGTQNGPNVSPGETSQIPTSTGQLRAGGGVGGVGGEGLGTAVTDQPTLTALGAPTADGSALRLSFLYPYDKTVFPRGLLAPLVMWSWAPPGGPAAPGDADAIKIDLVTTTGSFNWSGTFARPAILAMTKGPFIRMPIPQDVWEMATNTAGGKTDQLTMKLTVAKGGMAYGPISQTWTIAPVRLDGTIYYQSYGTQLVQNYPGAVGGNKLFGAGVLSIRVGDTAPKVVAGTAAMNPTGCRVCHSVAAGGTRLIAVHGDNESLSSSYDLSVTPPTEAVMAHLAIYPAMYPDGSRALTAAGVLLPLPNDTTPIPTTGLTSVVTNLGQPAFSPDGTKIAFNPLAGSLMLNQTLYVMSFDKASSAFSNPTLVANDTGQPAATQPSWPAFLPDNTSIVYHHQTIKSIEDNLATRAGSHAQIYWTSGKSAADATPLDQLNGKGYLPKLPARSTLSCMADGYQVAAGPAGSSGIIANPDLDHSDDVDLNYEPTVLPLGGGGYAWVIFTSRRMYGSEATIPPFCSDPRGVDLIQNITTKKLWVAAVDLTQAPGTDSSHPAFYLPAQELLAGNARAFWSLDPCKGDGSSCTSGDQCCNGYCEPGDGGLVCSNTPPMGSCSNVGDKCTSASNCCDQTNGCLNGFCAINQPR